MGVPLGVALHPPFAHRGGRVRSPLFHGVSHWRGGAHNAGAPFPWGPCFVRTPFGRANGERGGAERGKGLLRSYSAHVSGTRKGEGFPPRERDDPYRLPVMEAGVKGVARGSVLPVLCESSGAPKGGEGRTFRASLCFPVCVPRWGGANPTRRGRGKPPRVEQGGTEGGRAQAGGHAA